MANPKFQSALQLVPQKCPPIWMMRQAGRYHSHYQKLKAKHSFMELCKQPELAAQVALGPILDFDFDVAILFSDLLFPLEALGMGLHYDPAPRLEWSLNEKTIRNLKPWEEAAGFLDFQRQAVRCTRELLPDSKSLIGFVGGPWTLYTYAVEGAHKGNLVRSKSNPKLFAEFSGILLRLLHKNIEMQLEGGAEVVMIFDTAAGELAPTQFGEWCASGLNELASTLSGRLMYYSKGAHPEHLQHLKKNPHWLGFGYDHSWDLPKVLKHKTQAHMTQGNFDQALLFLSDSEFDECLREYLRPFEELTPEQRAGWVCGLGHGVLPETPEHHVRQFVQTVREVFE